MKTAETQTTPATPQKPAQYLRQVFLERKERNSAYSTRAYARDLGISQTLLSLVLNGKRPLTVKQAAQIAILLDLPAEDAQRLLESTLISLPENSKGLRKLRLQRASAPKTLFNDYSIERFKIISQWYHIALLDLCTTSTFQNNPKWIASRLGISPLEARDALERLIALGFLEKSGDTLRKVDSKLYFVTQASEPAVRAFHKHMMSKAQAKLDDIKDSDFAEREISSITMAVNKTRIKDAKARIQKFQKEIAAFLTEGDCDEVFQMNLQLFPLTKQVKPGELK